MTNGGWPVGRTLAAALLAVPLTAALMCATVSAAPPPIKDRLLTQSEMPVGWRAHRSTSTTLDLSSTPCLRGVNRKPTSGEKKATASFAGRSGLPAFAESLVAGGSSARFNEGVAALGRCRSLTLRIDGKSVRASIAQLSLPGLGARARAFSLALAVTHVPLGADIVVYRAADLSGEAIYLSVGAPTPVTAGAFAGAAIAKAQGRPVRAIGITSVVAAPVRVAHTALGPVGYREVGSGPPLVLIMGFDGSMETWDPRFIDALAHHHEVVIFDNAGIGETRAPRGHLTIDSMADQTGALIGALRLGRPDVLGWSMGSMIAQALAVLHPTRVGRLVLCAPYPGKGTIEPTQQAITALMQGSPTALFPPDQRNAATGYQVSTSAWPKSAGAPAGVVAAQQTAIKRWWGGNDPAGRRATAISAPTLIADGTRDRLDPQKNARRVQELIRGAEVVLYPDAGHAFLFQDVTAVVSKVDAFLAS